MNRKHKGFTLIELSVVVGIIGILLTTIILSWRFIRTKAEDTKRKNDLRNISTALETYAMDHNDKYPVAVDGVKLGEDNVPTNALKNYMSSIPVDSTRKSTDDYHNYRYKTDSKAQVMNCKAN
jgi:prepilin-type N-terminal cleavage/methylation domain-containing protein